MKKILVVFLFLPVLIWGQKAFEYDYSRFYSNDSTGYLEIYYSFNLDEMQDDPSGAGHKGELGVKLTDETENEVYSKKWQFEIPAETEDKKNIQAGLVRIPLDPGHYNCSVTALDLNTGELISTSDFDFGFERIPAGKAGMSDLEVATAIKMDSKDENSLFYKNSLEVVPNSSLVFGDNAPVIFFYTEFYNLDSESSRKYQITHRLLNSRNQTSYSSKKNIEPLDNSIVEIGAVKVKDLPTGTYRLIVSVNKNDEKYTVARSKRIFVYNKDIIDSSSFKVPDDNYLASGLAFLETDELDDIFSKAEYIATGDEKDTWDNLTTLEARRKFMVDFWTDRENKFIPGDKVDYKAYFDRVKYATEKYGNLGMSQGWKTDRGRVFIVYGKPTKIDRFHFASESKPYEIWYYDNIEGGVLFVFADKTGFNEYRLIHSTKRGEIFSAETEQSLRNR